MSEESLTDRLTEEITSLSTKLVTAVSKQLELEEKLFQYHKENHQLRSQVQQLHGIDEKYLQLQSDHDKLVEEFKQANQVKTEHEVENKRLKGEVEDLTASLFDEANKMVSDASRETYNFKIKNKKLYEELDEKSIIIDNLQVELGELKRLIEGLESKNSTLTSEKDSLNHNLQESEEAKEINVFNSSIFAPKLKSIRFDLNNFKEFREFLIAITDPTFQFDLSNLKLQKWFKKIWVEEFETSVNVPATNFLNRWQKGKFFWSLLIEGKVKIEPIKGINETLKLDYNTSRNSTDQASNTLPTPTAINEPCEFCQEHRNDNLEHSRLHYLKLLEPETLTELIQYPLCNYCLIKLRNICEFFAKLRLINKNFYKLSFDNKFDLTNDYKVLKLYLMLILIRSKIFWSKIGYWDNINEVNSINVDEINLEHFKLLTIDDNNSIHSNEAIKSFDSKRLMEATEVEGNEKKADEKDKEAVKEKENKEAVEEAVEEAKEVNEKDVKDIENVGQEGDDDDDDMHGFEPINTKSKPESDNLKEQQATESKTDDSNVKELVNAFEATDVNPQDLDKSSEDEFKDSSSETFSLSRKNSKSKQFTKKMNNNLDDTLKMLEEINEN